MRTTIGGQGSVAIMKQKWEMGASKWERWHPFERFWAQQSAGMYRYCTLVRRTYCTHCAENFTPPVCR